MPKALAEKSVLGSRVYVDHVPELTGGDGTEINGARLVARRALVPFGVPLTASTAGFALPPHQGTLKLSANATSIGTLLLNFAANLATS